MAFPSPVFDNTASCGRRSGVTGLGSGSPLTHALRETAWHRVDP